MTAILSTRRRKITALIAVLALVAAGAAVAAWYFNKDSNTSGQFGNLSDAVQVTTAGQPVGVLFPGGSVDAKFNVQNNSGTDLKVTAIAMATGGTSSDPTCLSYVSANSRTLATPVPVPAGTSTITVPQALVADLDTPSACQGVSFERAVKLTISS